jgi:hypothetical protein
LHDKSVGDGDEDIGWRGPVIGMIVGGVAAGTMAPEMREGGGGSGAMTTLSEEASEFIIGTVTTVLTTADCNI